MNKRRLVASLLAFAFVITSVYVGNEAISQGAVKPKLSFKNVYEVLGGNQ